MTALATTLKGIKFQRLATQVIALALLAAGSVLVLMPMVWMLSASLKTKEASTLFPPQWIPRDARTVVIDGRECYIYAIPVEGQTRELALLEKKSAMGTFVNPDNPAERYELRVLDGRRISDVRLHWENYPKALTQVPFGKYLVNSLTVVVTTTIGVLVSCTFVAYGFARFRAKGLGMLFLVLLSTIMLPAQVTLIPQFVVFSKIGWYDTLLPLIIPAFFANAWDVFLLRQYIMTVPLELDDAARIDGCGPLGILRHIILPQAAPALATVAIFHSLWAWNDFFYPLIYLQSKEKWTVALGLQSFQALYSRNLTLLMAASTVAMLPCILIFFFAQRLFIQGVVISGIKG
jgi:multiple sugar transport system permease protein